MTMGKPTQDFVPIKEIRDGVVVLKDGGLRVILMASSLNLFLKSQEEQEATISQFRNFLNALEFDIQINVQSRRLDIRPYLVTLENRLKEQPEDLLRTQTAEYIGFIKWFTENTNIMNKNFYIVIPYSYAPLSRKNTGSTITKFLPFIGGGEKKSDTEKDADKFEEMRTQIEQRISIIQGGLSGFGIRSMQLGTQEIVEVYYKVFNPGETERSAPEVSQ